MGVKPQGDGSPSAWSRGGAPVGILEFNVTVPLDTPDRGSGGRSPLEAEEF